MDEIVFPFAFPMSNGFLHWPCTPHKLGVLSCPYIVVHLSGQSDPASIAASSTPCRLTQSKGKKLPVIAILAAHLRTIPGSLCTPPSERGKNALH